MLPRFDFKQFFTIDCKRYDIHLQIVGSFYYDSDDLNQVTKLRRSNTSSEDKKSGLGIAILYHKSSSLNANNGLGYWEYSMPNRPNNFRRVSENIGWPQNEQFPKVQQIPYHHTYNNTRSISN